MFKFQLFTLSKDSMKGQRHQSIVQMLEFNPLQLGEPLTAANILFGTGNQRIDLKF